MYIEVQKSFQTTTKEKGDRNPNTPQYVCRTGPTYHLNVQCYSVVK